VSDKGKKMRAKYRGYCYRCYYTIWQGEWIRYSGKARHLDCQAALKDDTPRQLQRGYVGAIGAKVTKKQVASNLEEKENRKKDKEVVLSTSDIEEILTSDFCALCKKEFNPKKGKLKIKDGLFVHYHCRNNLMNKYRKIKPQKKEEDVGNYANYSRLKSGSRRGS
jgi:hypothetical protein